ncbi:MAG TPA: hypothetical protein VNP89_01420 [Gaiellaceae bacterium]|nr:hypothetical protein [Gaiellaceae bacterium]
METEILKLRGDAADDKLALRLQPGSPGTLEADIGADGIAELSFDRSTFTSIDVAAGSGDDEVRIDQSGGAFTDESVTMNGGAGDDTLIGGAGAEIFIGGPGEDFGDGNVGADHASLGAGDDRFQWDPGDGSDTVEGEGGNDQLDFNASNAPEQIELSANAGRTRLTRNIGAITIDFDGIEHVGLRLLGGTDTVTVNDLAGTGVKGVDVDLSATAGGGDGVPDSVVVNGTDRRDVVQVTRSGDQVSVAGLAAEIRIAGSESLNDTLRIQTLDGDDDVTIEPDVELLITPVVNLGPGE